MRANRQIFIIRICYQRWGLILIILLVCRRCARSLRLPGFLRFSFARQRRRHVFAHNGAANHTHQLRRVQTRPLCLHSVSASTLVLSVAAPAQGLVDQVDSRSQRPMSR